MSSFRHIDEEAFGYKTAIDDIIPTFGNVKRRHPYDGGNALVENSDNLDGSGSVVLSSFEVHLRVNHPGSDGGKDRWKVEFTVDRSRDVIRPKTSHKKKRGRDTDGETVRLRELAVVLARAEQAAVEFVRDTVSGEGDFSFRYFDTDVDEAIAETNGANMIELGGLPDQKNEPVTDGGVETVEVEEETKSEGDVDVAFQNVESARHSVETILEELLPTFDTDVVSDIDIENLDDRIEAVREVLYRVEDDVNSAEYELSQLRDDQDGEA